MGLQDLNENLYERKFDTPDIDTQYESGVASEAKDFQAKAWGGVATPSVRVVDESFLRKKKWLLIALGAIGVVALVVGAFFVRRLLFVDTKVSLSVEGPQSVASAETVLFSLQYANTNWVTLHQA